MPPNSNVNAFQVVNALSYNSDNTPVTDNNTRLLTHDIIDINSPHLPLRVEEGNLDFHHYEEDRIFFACYYDRIYENKTLLPRSRSRRRGGMPRQISFSSPNLPRTSSNITDKVNAERLKVLYGGELEKGGVEVVDSGHPLHHRISNAATPPEPNCPQLLCESEKGKVKHHHNDSGNRFHQQFSSAPNLTRISCLCRKSLYDTMPSMVLHDYGGSSSSGNNSDIRNDIFIINHHHQNKQIVAQQNLTLHSSAAFLRKRRRWRRKMAKEGFKYFVRRMVPPQLKGRTRKAYNLEPSCGCLT